MAEELASVLDQQTRSSFLALLTVSCLLASCGGGGGADTSQPQAQEMINGIVVPPAPDATANSATVAGVDSNANGIRDDVERRLASEFGADPTALAVAREHATRIQAAITNPTTTNRQSYIDHSRCVSDSALLRRLAAQTTATVNTVERRRAYRSVMSGVIVNLEGC